MSRRITTAVSGPAGPLAKPHYQGINKKCGDLPLAIEVDTHDLLGAPRSGVTEI